MNLVMEAALISVLQVNLESMEMFSPLTGALRRTHYDGVCLTLGISKKDISVHAKIGAVQVCSMMMSVLRDAGIAAADITLPVIFYMLIAD